MTGTSHSRWRLGLIAAALLIAAATAGALVLAGTRVSGEQVSYTGPTAARCVPSRLNRSDVLKGTGVAVSPLPGSYDAMPKTQISFLGVPARDLRGVSVIGSITGEHGGRLRAYSQGDGASFVPSKPFHAGERVSVSGGVATSSGIKRFSFRFFVAYPDPIPVPAATKMGPPPAGSVQTFRSAPKLEPPAIDVTLHSPQATPGDIFLAPYSGPGSTGPAIFNQQGQLIWMHPLSGALRATNFQVQSYEGKKVLTWWQGYIPPQGFGLGEEIVANGSYQQIMKIKAGNGNLADLHDFHLEPDHTAVLTVFRTIHCDLTSINGPRDSAVTDALYQEIDVKTGLVRREWTSLDHVALSESYSKGLESSTKDPFDFFHMNTIDPRSDGTTLLSSRNTSALWLIDTKTGRVIEKIGGRKSTVTMGQGTRTAFQHDAMTLPNGDISIFDNGGSPFNEPYSEAHSRGVIVDVSTTAKTDTLVKELDHTPQVAANSQGSVQPQPGGKWFMGWGQEPYFSEFDSEGKPIYDARMWAVKKVRVLETESYRTYKFPWRATPHWPPSIAAEAKGSGLTVYASWNGATEVRSWKLLGGSSKASLSPLATAPKANFETAIEAPAAAYVQVEALNAAGAVIGRSPVVSG